jgi:hypothetical protein
MANITIFIDETGDFSFNSKTSSVGGWVYKAKNETRFKIEQKIEGIIKASVKYFNNYLISEQSSFKLDYPSHMHFMPLHLSEQREKDKTITIHPRHIPIFFNHLFNELNNITLQVFKSTGKPVFMPNEQATYIDILRNTLLQLVDHPKLSSQKLTIIIAQRRVRSLYGYGGFLDQDAYEQHIIKGLTQELLDAFPNNKPELKIIFDSARKNPGLIVADFFCGAQRWQKNDYLKEYTQLSTYPFANGYKRIGNRLVQQLEYIQESDTPTAAILCTEVLSTDPDNTEIKSLLISMIEKMGPRDKSIFCKSISELFDEKLVNDPDRYNQLKNMNKLVYILHSILPTDYHKMPQVELKLIATLLLNQIRIDSHLGKTENTSTNLFLSFLDEYGENTFENQMEIMQKRIDSVLMGVQIKAFNKFKFNIIEENIKEIKDKYYSMFNFDLESTPVKDNNLARLEGTLGQMYGFLYDIEQDNDYFELAELSLQTDIIATIDDTPSSEQAHGYLTTLYWKSGNLEKATKQFIKETKNKVENINKIYNLSDTKTFSTDENPFIQLHRLYLCALATKGGSKINRIEKEKEFLLKQNDLYEYPKLLSAKWLAIIFLLNDDYNNAAEILERALTKKSTEDTIDVIRISLKLLQHYSLIKLDRASNFSCQKEVKALGLQQKEFEEVLIKRGIEKYYQNEKNWSVYEIGILLPFYFS